MTCPEVEPGYELAIEADDVTVWRGDCLDVLRAMEPESVDAVVCDPPYGLEFMGKDWDRPWAVGMTAPGYADAERLARPGFGDSSNPTCGTCGGRARGEHRCECAEPAWKAGTGATATAVGRAFQQWCELWAAECLRVLKPGGHLLAFGGTRMYHRLACAIEDAGFEVRDCITWLYAQGFPKSLNVGKAAGDAVCTCEAPEHDVPGVHGADVPTSARTGGGQGPLLLAGVPESSAPADGPPSGSGTARSAEPGVEGRGDAQEAEGQLHGRALREVSAGPADHGEEGRLRDGAPARHGEVDRAPAEPDGGGQPRESRPVGQPAGEPRPVADERGPQAGRGRPLCVRCGKPRLTGFGTALKPASEPIVVARKPMRRTVADNVLTYGTGALNIDGCRVQMSEPDRKDTEARNKHAEWGSGPRDNAVYGADERTRAEGGNWDGTKGRWPSNVVLSHSVECVQTGSTVDVAGGGAAGSSGFVDGYTSGDGFVGRSIEVPVYACVEGCPVIELDRQSGGGGSGTGVTKVSTGTKAAGSTWAEQVGTGMHKAGSVNTGVRDFGDVGGASRFFPTFAWRPDEVPFRYVAKARTDERPVVGEVQHPTVKPVALMQWLVRLVTAPGQLVLDPFAGSGTTLEAAILEGRVAVGIEREPDYVELIRQRVSKPLQQGLF